MNRLHSVILDEDACKGCTICVTGCPTEAIRVRDGKARITAERCIDCGECIRRCPHRAKKAMADSFASFPDAWKCRFDRLVALPAPSLYGQFPPKYSIEDIHRALRSLGFDEVFPVAAATPAISRTQRDLLEGCDGKSVPRPLISSSCPTVVKYVQIRFPTLLENLAPVIAPMELAARMAKARGSPRTGCFFISPCAGKVTEAMAPVGIEGSEVDGVFPMSEVHLPLLQALIKNARERGEQALSGTATELRALPSAEEISWGRAGGEADTTLPLETGRTLAVDGMEQCIHILEATEDGKLEEIRFLELMACPGGCTGGPLTACNPALARHHLRERERALGAGGKEDSGGDYRERLNPEENRGDYRVSISSPSTTTAPNQTSPQESSGFSTVSISPQSPTSPQSPQSPTSPTSPSPQPSSAPPPSPFACPEACGSCLRSEPFPARPALRLDPDFDTAMEMMKRMDDIRSGLPGLDCGCCGAPNCQALAEDIVRGLGAREDCVIIMRDEYRELLEQRWQSGE